MTLSLLCVALLSSARARAGAPELESAREMYRRAGELEDAGDFRGAEGQLRAALQIRETPHLRYALGWALENQGRWVEARVEYELALRLAQSAGAVEVTALATGRLAELHRRTPLLRVRVEDGVARRARVTVDGREVALGEALVTLAVDPGRRLVRVLRDGAAPYEVHVETSRQGVHNVDVPRATVGTPERRSPAPRSAVPWVVIATAGTLSAAAATLLIASLGDAAKRDELRRRWCESTACIDDYRATLPESPEAAALREESSAAADRGNGRQVAAGVLGGVGVAGLVVGTVLVLRGGSSGRVGQTTDGASVALVRGGVMAGAGLSF